MFWYTTNSVIGLTQIGEQNPKPILLETEISLR